MGRERRELVPCRARARGACPRRAGHPGSVLSVGLDAPSSCGRIDPVAARRDRLVTLDIAQKEFEPTCVYVNTASIGLPPRRVVEALDDAIAVWRTGRAEAADYDKLVDRGRRLLAALLGVTPHRVAIGNQVSTFTGPA